MYGPLRPDLTPPDLRAAGYGIRTHVCGGWCWWQHNPRGNGEIYGASRATVAEAIADARWLMGGVRVERVGWAQLSLLEGA